MAHINFEIPVVVSELLQDNSEHYYVKEAINAKRLPGKLKEAKQLYKEDGIEYIFDYFDTYISVILNITQLSRDVQVTAFEDLHRATKDLDKSVSYVLSDKDILTDEVRLKYVNLVKMLIYAYVNVTIAVNNKDPSNTVYKKGRSNLADERSINKNDILLQINSILHQEINLFWDPPVVEEALINQIAEVCYNFIEQSLTIKSDKELCINMFHIFGTLLTKYRYGSRFVYRIAEVVKSYEHAVPIISEGIKLLVESYNTKSLIREFVKRITEWQTDVMYQNAQATRNCAHVLSEMAKIMPESMLEEVMYLTEYLNNESYTLRISVINVITEVILTVFSKPDLNNKERSSRDELFDILLDHMLDVSAFVRARVIQNWGRLQKENILRPKMQTEILRKIILHLRDKTSNVRRTAANCVTSFLEHNPFGSELKLKRMQETLEKERSIYEEMKQKHCEPHFQKLKESEEAWEAMKDEIVKIIENNLNDDDNREVNEFNIPKEEIPGIVQTYLQGKKYDEAVKITLQAVESIEAFNDLRDTIAHKNEEEFLLKLIHNFYLDIASQLLSLADTDREDVKNLNKQQKLVDYYEDVVKFLKVLETSIQPMRDLLESVNISEMHEAIDFFIATYKFDIDDSLQGILEMLHIMQRPEQDRKVAVTNALRAIFLETDATSMPEHRKIIVDRLINLMETITFDKIDSFKLVIHNWVSEGKLDNNIIECVFQYFIKKHDIPDKISLKALQLLSLIAPAKKSIVTKNLRMISELVFENRGIDNMILFSETCHLITTGTREQQLVTDKSPPFKLKPTDPMWSHIVDILCKHFDNVTIHFYNTAAKNAVRLIYTLCSKPDEICETILNTISKNIDLSNTEQTDGLPCFLLIRLCVLLAEVAVCQLSFLDETVYKEIKRRLYVATEKANTKNKRNVKDYSTASSSRRNATTSASIITDDGEESVLEGAQADDAEADFILNILENKIVTLPTSLGAFAPLIVTICENPDKYDDECLQCVAVLAMLRYMLVSSKFCSSYVRLVFTILEKTKYPEVKCTVVINLSDLLERFPNVIEPWSLHIYNRLNDTDLKVQKITFYTLANLLLRDMLRVKSHIAFMAIFISEDENNELSNMSKNFFNTLSVKDNHLYNVLPDIFSHLVGTKDVDEDQFRFIMKYLINLITSTKHTENLVDRFCIKFMGTEDVYICRNIAYCLSLLQYNEKAVKKFLENFNSYKHVLHDRDVYTFVKQTMNSWNKLVKNDIKAIVAELEDKINSVFQITEDDKNEDKSQPKPVFKKPKAKPVRKHKKRILSLDNDSDGEDEDNTSAISTPSGVRKSNRVRRGSNKSMSD